MKENELSHSPSIIENSPDRSIPCHTDKMLLPDKSSDVQMINKIVECCVESEPKHISQQIIPSSELEKQQSKKTRDSSSSTSSSSRRSSSTSSSSSSHKRCNTNPVTDRPSRSKSAGEVAGEEQHQSKKPRDPSTSTISTSSSSRSSSTSSSSSSDKRNKTNLILDGPSTSKSVSKVARRAKKNYRQSPMNSNESDVDLSDSDPTYLSPILESLLHQALILYLLMKTLIILVLSQKRIKHLKNVNGIHQNGNRILLKS